MKKKILNFTTVIEQGENGWYIATVPDIPGCYTQGKTIAQVLESSQKSSIFGTPKMQLHF